MAGICCKLIHFTSSSPVPISAIAWGVCCKVAAMPNFCHAPMTIYLIDLSELTAPRITTIGYWPMAASLFYLSWKTT